MTKLYRQVSVEDRLPTKSGSYFVWTIFEGKIYEDSIEFDVHNNRFFGTDIVTHWLEEIELPTHKEIDLKFPSHTPDGIGLSISDGKNIGAKWLCDEILNFKKK